MTLADHFAPFRANIIGIDQEFESPFGLQTIVYLDWTASGRMFGPIEKMMSGEIAPFVGNILADQHRDRLGIISFFIDGLHYNLAVRLLNDRFGIQTRGGCSCAGTYGHYLLGVSREFSRSITDRIENGDQGEKPGWVRFSLHPTTTDAEAEYVAKAIAELAVHHRDWARDYTYNPSSNEFSHATETGAIGRRVNQWFDNFGRASVISSV